MSRVSSPLLFQEFGLDEVERLLRRPRSNSKERLVDVLLELVAACKSVSSHSTSSKVSLDGLI